MTEHTDHADWLTKAQVADALGVSTKTVEKLAADGQLQQANEKRAGKPAIVVYHPRDVERVRKERNPEAPPFVVPDAGAPTTETALAKRIDEPRAIGALAGLMSQLGQAPRVRLSERIYLSVKDAAELTGLTRAYLLRKIEAGDLPAIKDVSWKIRRSDLEKL